MSVKPGSIRDPKFRIYRTLEEEGLKLQVNVTVPKSADVGTPFVVLPFTVNQWSNKGAFPDARIPENRNWFHKIREDADNIYYAVVCREFDANAVDMMRLAVFGFAGGDDWAQSPGESIRMAEAYGNLD